MLRERRHTGLAAVVAVATVLAVVVAPIVAAADTAAPAVGAPVLSPATALPGAAVTVTATATDDTAVASAEVTVDGGPWAAMSASDGVFGDEPSEDLTGTVVPENANAIAVGRFHSCAVLGDATLRCWGQNVSGKVGDGTTVHRFAAVRVPGLAGVDAVALGEHYTCALLDDTTVSCWGNNFAGQVGDDDLTDHLVPTAVAGLTGVTAIAAGWAHTCAILADTTVRCWGFNDLGELGDGSEPPTEQHHPVAVMSGATPLSGVTAVAAGAEFTCALLADTTVRCWGLNQSGQLGTGTPSLMEPVPSTSIPGLTGVTAISAGWGHMCALLADATVRCWGDNFIGQLGNGDRTNQPSPVEVPGLSGVTAVVAAAGGYHTCALLIDTTVRCWGSNASGALGDGDPTAWRPPVAVAGVSGVTALGAGSEYTCALLSDTTVRCWGDNAWGQLGDGMGTHTICVRSTDDSGDTSDGTACATLTITLDTGGDGVSDEIAGSGTGEWSHEGMTGSVAPFSSPLSVLVEPAVRAGFVRITVSGTGTASFSMCGESGPTTLLAPTVAEFGCGSIIAHVISGAATFTSGATTVKVPAGVTAEIDVTPQGTVVVLDVAGPAGATVSVTIDGTTVEIGADTPPTSFPVTTLSLCNLTTDLIEGSARYTALTPKQQAAGDAHGKASCTILAQITPKLSAKQKAARINAYSTSVQALVQPGWLTQAQADLLKTLATTL